MCEEGFGREDCATVKRCPRDVAGTENNRPIVHSNNFVTKRRQKDFNGNHPDFQELLTTDDYTRYRDNSGFSGDTTEEDETSETDENVSNEVFTQKPLDDDSFNYNELNKTESPGCCPLLARRRIFDRKTNARRARDNYKRHSQEKRIATYNTFRSRRTSESSNASEDLIQKPKLNCNTNESDDTTCDFESLINHKISEINFERDESVTEDISVNLSEKSKRIDKDPFFINSRLPNLSRPSEMFFVTRNTREFVKIHEKTQKQEKSWSNFTKKIVIFFAFIYLFFYVKNLMCD